MANKRKAKKALKKLNNLPKKILKKYGGLDNDLVREFEEANRKLKQLERYKGSDINRFSLYRAKELLRQFNKKSFNTRGLSPAQRVFMQEGVKKLNKSKTFTIKGARETYENQRRSLYDRLEPLHSFNPENYEKYVDLLRDYDINTLALIFGYPNETEFWHRVMKYVNKGGDSESLDEELFNKEDELIDQVAWESENLPNEEFNAILQTKQEGLRKALTSMTTDEIDEWILEAFLK